MKINFFLLLFSCAVFSSNAPVYQYRIYCQTEGKNVYTWSETMPTKCPNNTSDTINPSSISIIDERDPSAISIQMESVPTGGHFATESVKVIANPGPNVVSTVTISWPFNISVLQCSFIATQDNIGDFVTAEIPSNALVGTIAQNVSSGDTTIYLSQSVMNVIAIGFYLKLSDGVNLNDLGRVIAINQSNNSVQVEKAATNSFVVSTPTGVLLSVIPINNFELGPAQQYTIGQSSLATSHIPANLPVVISYLNNSNTQKTLIITYEYLY